jgi:hypothetical protein
MREEARSLLGLSQDELDTLQVAASLLPPASRDGFLRSVANRWARDNDLNHAIRLVLGGYGVAAGQSVFKGRMR